MRLKQVFGKIFSNNLRCTNLNMNLSVAEICLRYNELKNKGKRLILCVTVGRSGTRWLADVFSAHKNAIGWCERNVNAESFYRYVKWNKLPIDVSGVIIATKFGIINDWLEHDISFITSPYFSHDIEYLIKVLDVDDLMWAVNDGVFTVNSFLNKGWYDDEIVKYDNDLISGYQPIYNDKWNHIFGRLVPTGDFFNEWKKLTRVGKISWLYNVVNMEIYSQIKEVADNNLWIFKLEEADQNYEYYSKLAKNYNLEPLLRKKEFLSLKQRTVRPSDVVLGKWSQLEIEEHHAYTAEFNRIYKTL